jgi:hypothetical protein
MDGGVDAFDEATGERSGAEVFKLDGVKLGVLGRTFEPEIAKREDGRTVSGAGSRRIWRR